MEMLIAIFVPAIIWIFLTTFVLKIHISYKVYFASIILALLCVVSASIVQTSVFTISYANTSIAKPIVVAVSEESLKILFFALLIKIGFSKNNTDSKTYLHLKIIAILFGLFFASFENIAYELKYDNIMLFRIFTATILHAGLASFYAHILTSEKKVLPIAGIILLHTVYNVSTLHSLAFFVFGFAILLFSMLQICLVFWKKNTHKTID